ncbi:NAD(P)H-binding protein [Dactylosporangium vinaceum]|uniref:NAD(P)H-binding protein n=1 Tax=Dactylosporangium vinaceum TaxID=53362 RepID=A0ABV5M3Z0_9ACTN|nr:NAD(P)H-binding protein [Dactylosporangium vinaceum]UAB93501.1 NAD(P)H-binding protein [Dactylosporangium vinaceum]
MIVVTGATGNVGRPLVRALNEAGQPVRPVTRRGPGSMDLARPESLRPALEGADALFLLVPGAFDGAALLREVQAAGLQHIVLLSSQAAGTRSTAPSHAPLKALEDLVKGSGLRWTVLRPGGFASNAFAWADTIRAAKRAYSPYAHVALPIVDPADVAEVAAAALLDDHHGQTYVLTGPAATTPQERLRAIGDAIGAELELVELTPDEARERMLAFMPAPVVDGTLAILGRPLPEEQAVSRDVERVLGRPARSFQEWAGRHRAVFQDIDTTVQ